MNYLTFRATFRPTTISSQKLRKEMFLLAFALALLGLYVMVLATLGLPFFVAGRLHAFHFQLTMSRLVLILASAILGSLLLLSAVLIICYRFFIELRSRKKRSRKQAKTVTDEESAVPWVVETLVMFGLAVTGGCLLYSFMVCGSHVNDDFYKQAAAVFSAYRYTSLFSGVSPMLPLSFAAAAAIFSLFASIRRMVLLEGMGQDTRVEPAKTAKYLDFGVQSLKPTAQIERRLYRLLVRSLLVSPIGALLVVWVFACWLVTFFDLPDSIYLSHSIEGSAFDWLFALLALVVYCDIALGFYRFLRTWWEFRSLLRTLSWHPLTNYFRAFSESTPLMPRLWIMADPPSLGALALSLQQATDTFNSADPPDMKKAEQEFSLAALAHARSEDGNALAHAAKVRTELRKYGCQVASLLEAKGWPPPPSRPDTADDATKGSKPAQAEDPELKRLMLGGRFLTSRVVEYCQHILAHLGNLVSYNTASLLMMLFAVSWYPFPRDDSLLRLNWLFVLSAVSIAVFVSVQVSRNKVLSLLSGGRPNEIDWNWDFVKYLLVYAALPILGFVGLRPPSTLHGLYGWLTGLLSSGN